MGRPQFFNEKKLVNFLVEKSLWEEFKRYNKKHNLVTSEILRQCIVQLLNKEKKMKKN